MRPQTELCSALLVLCTGALSIPTPAQAGLRSPQIAVQGTGLQSYLNSVGETIVVSMEQSDVQHWQSTTSNNSFSFTIQVELGPKDPSASVGFYSASAVTPELYEMFPAEATSGWFAVVSYRSAPVRAIVNIFDASAALRSTRTYLGPDRNSIGFYESGPGGTFYTEDARNPDGRAKWLTFPGEGINSGSWWIAGEETAVAAGSSDQDYDDTILFLESSGCGCTATVSSTWGALKARYH
jgi:hypothetical protein